MASTLLPFPLALSGFGDRMDLRCGRRPVLAADDHSVTTALTDPRPAPQGRRDEMHGTRAVQQGSHLLSDFGDDSKGWGPIGTDFYWLRMLEQCGRMRLTLTT